MYGICANSLFQASVFSKGNNGKCANGCNRISFRFGNARPYVTDNSTHCLS